MVWIVPEPKVRMPRIVARLWSCRAAAMISRAARSALVDQDDD